MWENIAARTSEQKSTRCPAIISMVADPKTEAVKSTLRQTIGVSR